MASLNPPANLNTDNPEQIVAQPVALERIEAVVIAEIESFGSQPGTRSESGTTAYQADIQVAQVLAKLFTKASNS